VQVARRRRGPDIDPDTGAGIPAGELVNIFKDFYR